MDRLRRLVFQRSLRKRDCEHLDEVKVTEPAEAVCDPCVDAGAKWVHVRMCMACGYVGCCDSSKLQHAREHHIETGHPLIRSVEPGETWGWCYPDRAYLTQGEYS